MIVCVRKRLLRLSATIVMAVGGLLAGAAAPAAAHPGVPSSRFDPNVVQWASVRNATPAEFGAFVVEQRSVGGMMIDLDVDLITSSSPILGGVFQRNLDGRDWFYLTDVTEQTFRQAIELYRSENMRPVDIESYVDNGIRLWSGVWVENVEGYSWNVALNASGLAQWSDNERAAGRMLVDVDAYRSAGNDICCLFAAVSVRNAEGRAWTLVDHVTSSEFNDIYNNFRMTHRRPLVVDSVNSPTGQRFSGIWVHNPNDRNWTIMRGMTLDEWAAEWQEQADAGNRVINYERYQTDDGIRYLGVWRQNN